MICQHQFNHIEDFWYETIKSLPFKALFYLVNFSHRIGLSLSDFSFQSGASRISVSVSRFLFATFRPDPQNISNFWSLVFNCFSHSNASLYFIFLTKKACFHCFLGLAFNEVFLIFSLILQNFLFVDWTSYLLLDWISLFHHLYDFQWFVLILFIVFLFLFEFQIVFFFLFLSLPRRFFFCLIILYSFFLEFTFVIHLHNFVSISIFHFALLESYKFPLFRQKLIFFLALNFGNFDLSYIKFFIHCYLLYMRYPINFMAHSNWFFTYFYLDFANFRN